MHQQILSFLLRYIKCLIQITVSVMLRHRIPAGLKVYDMTGGERLSRDVPRARTWNFRVSLRTQCFRPGGSNQQLSIQRMSVYIECQIFMHSPSYKWKWSSIQKKKRNPPLVPHCTKPSFSNCFDKVWQILFQIFCYKKRKSVDQREIFISEFEPITSLLLYTVKSCHHYLMNSLRKEESWSWSYGSWIYNCLCNQYLSPLTLWVRIPLLKARCTRYNMNIIIDEETKNTKILLWLSCPNLQENIALYC